jgi:hypothetical protein
MKNKHKPITHVFGIPWLEWCVFGGNSSEIERDNINDSPPKKNIRGYIVHSKASIPADWTAFVAFWESTPTQHINQPDSALIWDRVREERRG